MPLAAIFSSSHFPSNPSPLEKPWLSSSPASGGGIAGVRMPTAPWMTSPLILPADQILDLWKPRKKNRTADEDNASDRFLSSGVRGGRSREAMRKILKSVSLLRKILPPPPEADSLAEDVSVDFALPLNGLDTISSSDTGEGRKRKQPWAAAKEEKLVIPRVKKKRILPKAEMVLPAEELERLRGNAMKMRKWVRGKKAGVTPEVMKGIRKAWRKNELAVVKIVDPLRQNMVRAHEIVEILGMSNSYWVAAVSHARTCPLGGRLYVYHAPHYAIVLNPICEIVNIEVEGVSWTFQELSLPLRATVQNVVSEAYNSWDSFEEISLPLATGEPVNQVVLDPHPIEGYFEVGLIQNEEQMGVYNSTQVMPNILFEEYEYNGEEN